MVTTIAMMVRLVKCINVASIGSDSKVVVEAPLVDTVGIGGGDLGGKVSRASVLATQQ